MKTVLFFLVMLFSVETIFASETLSQLKSENHFVMIRHARAPGTGDPANFKLGDCKTQRNLSSAGIEQAKALGKTLGSKLGKDFWVFTSEWCRCRDTAKLLGGKEAIDLPILNSFFQRGDGAKQTKELRVWIKENLSKYNPMVLVTHQVNITEVTGVFPQEGEILVLKIDASGNISRVE